MDQLEKSKQLRQEVEEILDKQNTAELTEQRDKLKAQSDSADFWKDNISAQKTMKELARTEDKLNDYQELDKDSKDLVELASLQDETLQKDIGVQLDTLQKKLAKIKYELSYGGPYDQQDAILSIFAGAGGTDAQDWAAMLLRMYTRWAEKEKYSVKVEDETPGEEAGIKSVQISISGDLAYGKLRGEHGVHRLVRLSPFNANNLRQTSFAKVEVLPKIVEPEQVPIDEQDLRIDVFRAGGHGGQSVNTTDSAVRVTHLPTSIVVSIQNERSQIQNKETALTILRSKLASLQLEQHAKTIKDLKGPNQSAEWGSQIRNYVQHPYSLVKDLRSRHETSDVQAVLDGDINEFIEAEKKL